MEFRKIKGIRHYVFDTYEELEAHFEMYDKPIPEILTNWREGEEGDWVISDDCRILQILKVGSMRKRPYKHLSNKYVRTVVGTFICDLEIEMDTDFSKRKSRYSFYGKGVVHHLSKKNAMKFYKVYKACVDPYRAYKSTFPKSNDVAYIKRRAIATLLSDEVLGMIKAEAKSAADRLKMDVYYVLKGLKELIEKTQSDNIKLGSFKEVSKIIDAYPIDDNARRSPFKSLPGYLEDVTPEEIEEASQARQITQYEEEE